MLVYVWMGLALATIVLELITVDMVSIWFTAGSIAALFVNYLGASPMMQIVTCLLVSFIFILIFRPFVKKYMQTNIVKTNLDRIVGKHGKVVQEINPDKKGEVMISGQSWLATSLDNEVLVPGDHCEILAIEGAHVIVKKIEG